MRNFLFLIMMTAFLSVSCSKSGGGGSGSSNGTVEIPGESTTDQPATPAPTPDPPPSTETPDSNDDDTTNDNVTETPPEEPETPAMPDEDSLPAAAYSFKTNIKFVNQTSTQKAKINKALEIIRLVIATDEFRSKVLNHTYGGRKTFVDNGGFTNEQIYQKILDGPEKLQNTKDNEMDLEVEMYTASTNVVGYTYPNSKRIWVNTKFFNQYTAAGVAHNLMHEWLHKLGFGHAASYSTSRDYSVPYAIGDLVGEIGKDFL